MPESTLGRGQQQSWGETTTFCNGTEVEYSNFEHSTQFTNGLNHAVNAYYVGELGRWTIDFNADYLNNRVNSNQYAEDGSKDDIHSSSDSRSKLYAAKLQVGVSLGKGQLSFGSEGTLTEREALFTQSGFSEDAENFIRQKTFAVLQGIPSVLGSGKPMPDCDMSIGKPIIMIKEYALTSRVRFMTNSFLRHLSAGRTVA